MKTKPLALLLALAALPASAATVTFQDGTINPLTGLLYAGTQDTTLVNNSGGQINDNYGGGLNFGGGELYNGTIHASDFPRTGLLRFNVTSLAGEFATIDSITLRLTVGANFTRPGGSDSVAVYLMAPANAGWVEGNGSNSVYGAEDVGTSTWFRKVEATANWAGSNGARAAGTDYLTPALATAAFTDTTTVGTVIDLTFNNVSFFDGWVNGNNAGLVLLTLTNSDEFLGFHSSEVSTVANRPQLIVDYTVPEPGTAGLLAVAGSAWLGLRRRR